MIARASRSLLALLVAWTAAAEARPFRLLHPDRAERLVVGKRFRDPRLRAGRVHTEADLVDEMPVRREGGFAAVFRVSDADGGDFAVRVFTQRDGDGARPAGPDHERALVRYQRLADRIGKARARGLRVIDEIELDPEGLEDEDGDPIPVMRSRWRSALTLGHYVDRLIEGGDRERLRDQIGQLRAALRRAMKELADAEIAHGDLQVGNLFVVEEPDGRLGLRLVDLDSAWSPETADLAPLSDGQPDFAHPRRGYFGPRMDHFNAIVIDTSLRALAERPELFNEAALVFDRADFQLDPDGPRSTFARLRAGSSPDVVAAASRIRDYLDRDPAEVPSLEEFLTGAAPRPPPAPVVQRRAQVADALARARAAGVRAIGADPKAGEALDAFVASQVTRRKSTARRELDAVKLALRGAIAELEQAGLAHGDLRPENIRVVRERGRLAVRLVGFERMWSRGWDAARPAELAPTDPAYRHPGGESYGPTMDRLPAILIYASLEALAARPRIHADRAVVAGSTPLLFGARDLGAPRDPRSRLAWLARSRGEDLATTRGAVDLIRGYLAKPPSATPSLEAFVAAAESGKAPALVSAAEQDRLDGEARRAKAAAAARQRGHRQAVARLRQAGVASLRAARGGVPLDRYVDSLVTSRTTPTVRRQIGEIQAALRAALDELAAHQVTHGDLRPENILVVRQGNKLAVRFGGLDHLAIGKRQPIADRPAAPGYTRPGLAGAGAPDAIPAALIYASLEVIAARPTLYRERTQKDRLLFADAELTAPYAHDRKTTFHKIGATRGAGLAAARAAADQVRRMLTGQSQPSLAGVVAAIEAARPVVPERGPTLAAEVARLRAAGVRALADGGKGPTLSEYLRARRMTLHRPEVKDDLRRVQRALLALAAELERHGIAHGQLDPTHLRVVEDGGELELRLIGSERMWTAALKDQRPTVRASRFLQHPRVKPYAREMDRFPALMMYASLEVLIALPAMGDGFFDLGRTILFEPRDLQDPFVDRSRVRQVRKTTGDSDRRARSAAELLSSAYDGWSVDVPTLAEFAEEIARHPGKSLTPPPPPPPPPRPPRPTHDEYGRTIAWDMFGEGSVTANGRRYRVDRDGHSRVPRQSHWDSRQTYNGRPVHRDASGRRYYTCGRGHRHWL